ncbi:MAG: hypothetical protein ACR2HN_10405 [Tepidiformaceae bacterium]
MKSRIWNPRLVARILVLPVCVALLGTGWFLLSSPGAGTDTAPGFLSICIAADARLSASLAPDAVRSLEGMEGELKQSHDAFFNQQSRDAGASPGGPVKGDLRFSSDCGQGFVAMDVAALRQGHAVRQGAIEEDLPFNIILFVVPDDDFAAAVGTQDFLRVPFAFRCDEGQHTCGSVASAVYMPAKYAEDPNLLAAAVKRGAGWDMLERYPNGHPPSEDAVTR